MNCMIFRQKHVSLSSRHLTVGQLLLLLCGSHYIPLHDFTPCVACHDRCPTGEHLPHCLQHAAGIYVHQWAMCLAEPSHIVLQSLQPLHISLHLAPVAHPCHSQQQAHPSQHHPSQHLGLASTRSTATRAQAIEFSTNSSTSSSRLYNKICQALSPSTPTCWACPHSSTTSQWIP